MKMKKRYVWCLLAILIIGSVAALIGLRRKPDPSGPTPDEIVKELLEFDRNGDGQLSKDELSERMQGLFERGDSNQDGILNKDELRKLAEAQAEATRRANQRKGERH